MMVESLRGVFRERLFNIWYWVGFLERYLVVILKVFNVFERSFKGFEYINIFFIIYLNCLEYFGSIL